MKPQIVYSWDHSACFVCPLVHRTCRWRVEANDERLSGEDICVVGSFSFWFRILIMLFDRQHIAPGEDQRGKKDNVMDFMSICPLRATGLCLITGYL